jgi:lysophospholipase L1-like esterase
VKLGGAPRYGEAPQAERLRPIARNYQVKMIVLTVGLNNVGFANLVIDCIRAYLWLGPRCQESWANRLPISLRDSAPKIAENIDDIRTVMREAGYADHDYQFVVQSYTSPFAADNRYWLSKMGHGCPIRNDDAKWGRDNAVPQITATIGQVAADAGVRFLDLGPSMHGREACANGVNSHAEEWANGIYIDVDQFKNGIGENLVSQGAHPNAQGYAQIARCLSDFYRMTTRNGRCARGSDGNLATVAIPEEQAVTPRIFPKIEEPPPPEAQD